MRTILLALVILAAIGGCMSPEQQLDMKYRGPFDLPNFDFDEDYPRYVNGGII